MPNFLNEVVIRNLRLGGSRVDVRLHRYGQDVTVNVLSREGTLALPSSNSCIQVLFTWCPIWKLESWEITIRRPEVFENGLEQPEPPS